MALQSGTSLGPYQIESPLGAGGMGEVYEATDTRLDRTVAIKVLPAHVADDPDLRQRFEREAKTISSLNHPHICTLYDIGQEGDTDFLVMEYLEGETLAERLTKGPLPTEEVLRYATEIADALDKAHRQGIVHRDLKPGNIMLTSAGTKLLDFGLAKLKPATEGGAGLTAVPTQSAGLTVQGTILGTLQYMAPEQLDGKEADARSDLFAFGAILYEAVAVGGRCRAAVDLDQSAGCRAAVDLDHYRGLTAERGWVGDSRASASKLAAGDPVGRCGAGCGQPHHCPCGVEPDAARPAACYPLPAWRCNIFCGRLECPLGGRFTRWDAGRLRFHRQPALRASV